MINWCNERQRKRNITGWIINEGFFREHENIGCLPGFTLTFVFTNQKIPKFRYSNIFVHARDSFVQFFKEALKVKKRLSGDESISEVEMNPCIWNAFWPEKKKVWIDAKPRGKLLQSFFHSKNTLLNTASQSGDHCERFNISIDFSFDTV